MPEVELAIRWADGHVQAGTSPSTAIERWLVQSAVYPRDELARRVRHGLTEASERVRQVYGYACTSAAQLTDELLRGAAVHGVAPDAPTTVERLRRLVPPASYPVPARLPARVDVVVIGGGQAGLSASWHLRQRGLDHVVLERDRVAGAWRRERWDSFCLVTPNFQCRLPEHPYRGPEPEGFIVRDEIVDYVESFAASFGPPVLEGVEVRRVGRDGAGGFLVQTSHGELHADHVVLAIGGYHRPRLPAVAARLPVAITQLHSSGYRNPSSLPDGAVLVVGSGQSGAQIAEDLLLSGRDVHLAVGSAPRVARRYRGRDCVSWLEDIGHYDMPIDDHPQGLGARREPNHYVTGRDGGRDIDLRAHALAGMHLHGRLAGARDGVLTFTGDLPANLDAADATAERIKDTIDRFIERRGIDAPAEARYSPVWEPPGDGSEPLDLEAAGVRSIVWATGFRSDWSWISVPELVGDDGYPRHTRGVCDADGIYVLGLPWLWTWGSGRFAGIARDAEYVVAAVADRARLPASLERATG
jgi:putative flavoprotein involved in K+ transport